MNRPKLTTLIAFITIIGIIIGVTFLGVKYALTSAISQAFSPGDAYLNNLSPSQAGVGRPSAYLEVNKNYSSMPLSSKHDPVRHSSGDAGGGRNYTPANKRVTIPD